MSFTTASQTHFLEGAVRKGIIQSRGATVNIPARGFGASGFHEGKPLKRFR